jgi:hypothetical protein
VFLQKSSSKEPLRGRAETEELKKNVKRKIKMKKLTILIAVVFLTIGFCFGQNEITVRKELNLLQPFLNKS